jgi:hypothetical protein
VPELTDEHIEGLFADLRTDEIRQVRPPGTAAARSTVQRRRTVRSVAAGAAVLAVAGGVAAMGLTDRNPSTGIADTTVSRPVYSDALLTIRRDLAASAIGVEPDAQGILDRQLLRGGFSSVYDVLGGSYALKLSCVGAGRIDLEVRTGDVGDDGVFDHEKAAVIVLSPVTCDGPGTMHTWTFPVSTSFLAISVQPDGEAKDQSAFAYEATMSTSDQQRYRNLVATAAKAAAGPADGPSLAGFLNDGTVQSVHDDTDPAGSHRISVACLGTGSVTVTASALRTGNGSGPDVDEETVIAERTVVCGSPAPATASLTFTTKGDRTLVTTLRADADAAGRAAAAYKMVID